MFYSTLFIAVTALSGFVSAQNYSTSGPLTIDPNSVELTLRQAWCRAEQNNCPLICGGRDSSNQCDPNALTSSCICSDGSTPNISDYAQTLPSLVCQQWVINCVASHPNDLNGQAGCHSVVCGMKNASAQNNAAGGAGGSSASGSASAASGSASMTASASSASGSGSASATASSSGSASSSSSSGSAAVMNVAMNYGTGILAGGMLAVFGLAL